LHPSPGAGAPAEAWLLSDTASPSSSLPQQKQRLIFIAIAAVCLSSINKEPLGLT